MVVSSGGKARFSGVAYSNNMRLDPVDAPKVAYKRQKEIKRALQDEQESTGSDKHDGKHGWHPHYHVILFVPKDNLGVLDELEPKLKAHWQRLVQKHYAKIFGKEIPESYLPALYKHGLIISCYSEDVQNEYGDIVHKRDEIYQVNDTEYFGKIMGCDSAEIADLYNETKCRLQ